MKNKVIITLLALTMTAAMLAGCGKETAEVQSEGTETVAEVSTETKAVVVDTETEESTEGAELVYNTENDDIKLLSKSEGSATVDSTQKSDSTSTSTGKNGKTDSAKNGNGTGGTGGTSSGSSTTNGSSANSGSGTSSSGNTSNSTSTSGTNSGSSSSGNSGTSTSQPEQEVASQPETPQEPQLESFPYSIGVVYENGDGTAYIYSYSTTTHVNPSEEEIKRSQDYPWECELKLSDAGYPTNSQYEQLGEYQEGYMMKITATVKPEDSWN